jgi:hypothetical protein
VAVPLAAPKQDALFFVIETETVPAGFTVTEVVLTALAHPLGLMAVTE